MSTKDYKGWIYIVTNESMPGLIKIGCTHNVVDKRIKDFFTTGVPTPFEKKYEALVIDIFKVEKRTHQILKKFRVPNREFFKCDITKGIQAIKESCAQLNKEIYNEQTFLNDLRSRNHEINEEEKYTIEKYSNGNLKSKIPFGDGIETHWYKSGKKKKEIIKKNGLKKILYRSYWKNGCKRKEIPYKNGIKDGKEIWYWKSGGMKKFEIQYLNGLQNGILIKWRRNGQKALEMTYRNGSPLGKKITYHLNGNKESEITYDDYGIGILRENHWYDTGKKQSESVYSMGHIIEKSVWYKSGNIQSITKYEQQDFTESDHEGVEIKNPFSNQTPSVSEYTEWPDETN